jgi:hypothetical protein
MCHLWRPRRSRVGELVQWDTSEHAWLDDRGPKLYLIGMIDDGSSRVHARRVSGRQIDTAALDRGATAVRSRQNDGECPGQPIFANCLVGNSQSPNSWNSPATGAWTVVTRKYYQRRSISSGARLEGISAASWGRQVRTASSQESWPSLRSSSIAQKLARARSQSL